jgi:hypothetical protein
MTPYRSLIPLVALITLLTGYNFISASWIVPNNTPAGNNRPAPITTDVAAQTKQGNLTVNLLRAGNEMRSPEYCDETGANCWDPASGTGGGGGGGGSTITVDGRCFQPAWQVACNWNWSGDGNDNAMHYRPVHHSPTAVCASVGRTYQYHGMVLAQCFGNDWIRSAWVQVGSTAQFTRTVTCTSNLGATLPDASCISAKPATTCTDTLSGLIGSKMGVGISYSSAFCPA